MKILPLSTLICLIGFGYVQAQDKVKPNTSASRPLTTPGPAVDLPLKVSANQRYLEDQAGKEFFPVIDTAWSLGYIVKEDVVTYLDNRKAKGFNTIYTTPFMFTNKNAYGEFAFNGGEWFGTPNPKYWNHIQYILDQIKQRKMQVWFVVAWANYNSHLVNDLPRAKTYVNFLQNRFPANSYPNLVWVLGGDPNQWDADTVTLWRMMGDHLKKSGDPRLVTFHPGGAKTSKQYFTKEESTWLDFHQLQSAHGVDTASPYSKLTTVSYDRPIINGEPLYELIKREATAEDVRQAIYQSLFSGGFGVTYGAHGVWGIGRNLPYGGVPAGKDSWRDNMNAPAASQMTHLATLMKDYPFHEASSDHLSGQIVEARKVVTQIPLERRGSYASALVANDRKWAVVYFPDIGRDDNRTIGIKLKKLSQPNIRIRWFDPTTGRYGAWSKAYKNSETVGFTAPGKNDSGTSRDWVLVLDSRPQ